MPNGKTHQALTAGLVWASLPALLWEPRLLALTAGIGTGLIVDPDLDVDGWTVAETRLLEVWKPLGILWFVIWWPYARLASHRGYSHWPLLGTFGRAVYLLAPALLVFTLLHLPIPWWAVGLWFAGLCLADLLHVLADKVWSRGRRILRRRSWR